MLLGVIFLSWRSLFPYVILGFKPSESRGPDGSLGKGGLYGLAIQTRDGYQYTWTGGGQEASITCSLC